LAYENKKYVLKHSNKYYTNVNVGTPTEVNYTWFGGLWQSFTYKVKDFDLESFKDDIIVPVAHNKSDSYYYVTSGKDKGVHISTNLNLLHKGKEFVNKYYSRDIHSKSF